MIKPVIEFLCPFCGNNQSEITKKDGYYEYGTCTFCGKRTYFKDFLSKTVDTYQPVRCPYCSSTNVTKITTASKVKNTLLFGAFAISKNSKEWRCHNCKSDF